MAARLRTKRDSVSDAPQSVDAKAALRGDLAQMSLATVLTVLELERRSGELRVDSDEGRVALFDLADGSLVDSKVDDKVRSAVEGIREVLRWTQGRFVFRNSEGSVPSNAKRHSVGAVLLEAMRLEDESRR
jgi:two-component system, OmpR family, response regulator